MNSFGYVRSWLCSTGEMYVVAIAIAFEGPQCWIITLPRGDIDCVLQ